MLVLVSSAEVVTVDADDPLVVKVAPEEVDSDPVSSAAVVSAPSSEVLVSAGGLSAGEKQPEGTARSRTIAWPGRIEMERRTALRRGLVEWLTRTGVLRVRRKNGFSLGVKGAIPTLASGGYGGLSLP